MRPETGDLAFLWDMREQASRLVTFTAAIDKTTFMASEELRLVAERRLEIIGEAASRLSLEVRQQHPEIPWREIIGQRNVLIHGYNYIRRRSFGIAPFTTLPD